jgi:hypothetical protein
MEPVAQCDTEITVTTVLGILCPVDFRQPEIVAGIQHHILILIGQTNWNAQIYRFANIGTLAIDNRILYMPIIDT